ncbi:CHAT domain-containing protein [Paradesertivirga mongoliensis]|uniref:CHAT domain-containing protein n=1 Tax=Paradesertivirga mongoliensis TaxID=2100740 RepID=A0ABW4ZJK1_9SPHI|nr:CHAT domain-containing tetratricopeptide repeat protein [Pedobacter mongoliensis]
MRAICLFIFLAIFQMAYAQTHSRQELDSTLENLKKQDKLSEWIYQRIAYSAEKPEERLPFLMATAGETWRKPKTNHELEASLNLLINQGYYQLYTGNVLQSIEEYERAHAFYQKRPLDLDVVEYVLKPLGNNYTRLGDYTNAIFIQKKSLEIARRNRDSLSVASVYNNLAISYKSMGDLKQAADMCLKGFSYLTKNSPLKGLLNSTLADVQFELGEMEKSSASITEALDILSRDKQDSYTAYWLLSAYTLAGNIEQQRGSFAKSRKYYQQGLQLIEEKFRGGRRREKANLLVQTGNILIKIEQPAAALVAYNRALQTLLPEFRSSAIESLPAENSLYGENRLYDALEGRANALLELNKNEPALSNFLLALKAGSKARVEFSDVADRLYYQKQSKRLAEKAINTAFALWQKTGQEKYSALILRLTEQTKSRTLSEHIERNRQLLSNTNNPLLKQHSALKRAIAYYEKEYLLNKKPSISHNKEEVQHKLSLLEKEIRKKYPSWNKSMDKAESSFEKVINEIPLGTRVLNFFWGTENVYLVTASTGRIDTIIKIANAPRLNRMISDYVERYFRRGAAAMTNHPEKFYSESQVIYKQLLLPGLRGIKQKKILIIADDILGYLPFESLITPGRYSPNISKWPFLLKKHPIGYAYSLQTWLSASSQKSSNPTFSGFFISKAEGGPPIPAVEEEARNLEHLIQGSQFIDKEATVKNFSQALSTSSSLHLSTHSYLFGKEKEPVLQLSDGKFFLFELSAQTKVPGLVVLSACGTADGAMATGEGILSLSRGFTAAGTAGVVAGLWNINDASSAQLITSFYSKLQKGNDASTALHQAKLDWISQQHSNHALLLPYYWSSLIYIGKPQTINLKPAASYSWTYWTLSLFTLAIFAGFLMRRKSRSSKE